MIWFMQHKGKPSENLELTDHPALERAMGILHRLKPDQFEIYLGHSKRAQIEAKDGKIETITQAEDIQLALRVLHHQRMGFSFTTSMEKEAIEKAAMSAMEIAQVMPEDPFNTLAFFSKHRYSELPLRDEKGLQIPIQEKVARALKLESDCRKKDARITAIRSAGISEIFSRSCLVDSQGFKIACDETLFTASITCKAEQGGDSQMGGDYGFSHWYESLDTQTVVNQSVQTATELLEAKSAPTLVCPAVFRNNVVAELLDFLSASFSAEQIDKGRSLLAGMQGKTIFSSSVTIVDDGTLSNGYASGPFDGEGTPSAKTVIVEKGMFCTALYDLYYAKKYGQKPTGVTQRRLKAPPSIGFTNLQLLPGSKSFDELCNGIERGILIVDLMGIHTANPVTGDFSLGASGILIEKGKTTTPVKGFAVAGNLLELFNKITDIGKDIRFFGNVGAPSVRVSELSVGGT